MSQLGLGFQVTLAAPACEPGEPGVLHGQLVLISPLLASFINESEKVLPQAYSVKMWYVEPK